jgi:hypothetical protein
MPRRDFQEDKQEWLSWTLAVDVALFASDRTTRRVGKAGIGRDVARRRMKSLLSIGSISRA